jgi:hypothetical protein
MTNSTSNNPNKKLEENTDRWTEPALAAPSLHYFSASSVAQMGTAIFEDLIDLKAAQEPHTVPSPPPDWRHLLTDGLTTTASEIAQLAGKKTPSVVNHWRKRAHHPFPKPMAGGRSPRYNLAAVVRWLAETKKLNTPLSALFLWKKTVKVAYRTLNEDQRPNLRSYITALAVLSQDNDADEYFNDAPRHFFGHGKKINAATISGGIKNGDLKEICRHLAQPLLAPENLGRVWAAYHLALDESENWYTSKTGTPAGALLDEALDALSEAEVARSSHTTNRPLVDLVTDIVNGIPVRPENVLDIACGEGTLMIDLWLNGPKNTTLSGIDNNQQSSDIALARFGLHGIKEGVARIACADATRWPIGEIKPDVTLIDPPKPTQTRVNHMYWESLARTPLTPKINARALVFCPAPKNVVTVSPDEKNLEAVILLPARLNSETRDGVALKIFTYFDNHCEKTLVIDLSDIKIEHFALGTHASNQESLPTKEAAKAITDWRKNRRISKKILAGRQREIVISEIDGEIKPFGTPTLKHETQKAITDLLALLETEKELTELTNLGHSLERLLTKYTIPEEGIATDDAPEHDKKPAPVAAQEPALRQPTETYSLAAAPQPKRDKPQEK